MNEEINMLSYFTPRRREVSSYINNKGKIIRFGAIGKSPNPTNKLF